MINEFVSFNKDKQADAHVLMFGCPNHVWTVYRNVCIMKCL
jgi:hypothetical protein